MKPTIRRFGFGLTVALGAGLLLIGCGKESSKQTLLPSEYLHWVENPDNGLHQGKDIGNYYLELQYKPPHYIVALEGQSQQLSEKQVASRVVELDGLTYFTFRITSLQGTEMLQTGPVTEEEYQYRSYYFDTQAQRDMYLVSGTDTLNCALYHFERNYGLAPYNNMVLGFEKPVTRNTDLQFVFDDPILGLGPVKFTIGREAIEQLPHLKTTAA